MHLQAPQQSVVAAGVVAAVVLKHSVSVLFCGVVAVARWPWGPSSCGAAAAGLEPWAQGQSQ